MRSGSKAKRVTQQRLCAVSVDLDEISCYTAIHGLAHTTLSDDAQRAVYRKALPRLVDLFERLAVPVTFFAVGRDLTDPQAASALHDLARRGHEIANHSQDHLYDLTLRPRAEMQTQVAEAARAIERVTGQRPRGFRAPGYTITDELYEVLQEQGVAYDSSVFPCPLYYGAKVAAIGGYRLRGRPTRSIVDHPRVLTAPAEPYHVGRPYSRAGTGLLELPIGVTRDSAGRLPFIGTSLIMAGMRGTGWLCQGVAGRNLVNLELHGIDAADAELDGLTSLRSAQPDLRHTAEHKLAVLAYALRRLHELGYRFVTLEQAAAAFSTRAAA
jgi:peptidoglycan/xylan/chitin deacetylase (PgdA/CDA1 family)